MFEYISIYKSTDKHIAFQSLKVSGRFDYFQKNTSEAGVLKQSDV
jgi:hypothetical protein